MVLTKSPEITFRTPIDTEPPSDPDTDLPTTEISPDITPAQSASLAHLLFDSSYESETWKPVSDERRAEIIEERRQNEKRAALKYSQTRST